MSDWNSNQYIRFQQQRTQPSLDLIHRIQGESFQRILDIGCGPGNSTNALATAFPTAEVIGIDSSEDMLQKAVDTYPDIPFVKGTIPNDLDKIDGRFDLIFSNACIHWIPNHQELIRELYQPLNEGGILAVQIPLIQEAPFYQILNQIVSEEKWKKLSMIQNFHNLLPEEYYDLFTQMDCTFSIWQTAYYHVMDSAESIVEWYKGSGLRPYLESLSDSERLEFVNELQNRIRQTYPVQTDNKIILKMPRLFFILQKG